MRITPAVFDTLFPFHVAFDSSGRVTNIGRSIGKLSPGLRVGIAFAEQFEPKRPMEPFEWARLAKAAGRLYTVRERVTGVVLRGQFQLLEEKIFFLGTPWIADGAAFQVLKLTLNDFAVHDPTLDLMQLLQLRNTVEDDLKNLTSRLKAQSVQLAEAARSKDAFLASISHELRTPLTGILGMSEILAEQLHGPLTEKQMRDIRIIHTSGKKLLKLINNVIELAKYGAGLIELRRESCPVGKFCGPAFERGQAYAENQGQRLSLVDETNGAQVNVDVHHMAEAISHLIENSCKFSAANEECGLRMAATDSAVKIEVWDHGIGIEAENLAKLFSAFTQLDDRLARRYDGSGLGLALVKKCVELHGGQIEVASQRHHGTQVTVTLPRVPRSPLS